jgi:hypothetical protein
MDEVDEIKKTVKRTGSNSRVRNGGEEEKIKQEKGHQRHVDGQKDKRI